MSKFNITQEMKDILTDYSDDVMNAVVEALGEVAEEAAEELKQTSPRRKKHGGSYAKDWSVKEDKKRTFASAIVYNKKHYQLTHLLEYGHATKNGGRKVEPIVHIEPVSVDSEEKAIKKITEAIEKL